MTEQKNLWILRVPTGKPEDQLYNRRLLSYYSLAFSAIWVHEILLVIIIGMALGFPMDAGTVAALVGVPAALSGLGFWKYLEAAKATDLKQPFTPSSAVNVEAEQVTIHTPPAAETGPPTPQPD